MTALLCFEAAARTENFSRAAESMNITQSALSRQIRELESYLAQPLFTRARQRVALTSAGRRLVADLAPQLELLEATVLRLRSFHSPDGAINVGTYPTLGSRWLMPLLGELAVQDPNLTINTLTYLSNSEIDPSQIDIGIVQGDPPFKNFRATSLMPETLIAVASPSIVAAPLEAAPDLLTLRILQHATRPESWSIWLKSQGFSLPQNPIGPVFTQFEMLIDAVKRGHGIAIIPRILVKRELDEGSLILAHRHEATPASAYYLLVPELKTGMPRIERFHRWLIQRCA